jgi:hypothetical protein
MAPTANEVGLRRCGRRMACCTHAGVMHVACASQQDPSGTAAQSRVCQTGVLVAPFAWVDQACAHALPLQGRADAADDKDFARLMQISDGKHKRSASAESFLADALAHPHRPGGLSSQPHRGRQSGARCCCCRAQSSRLCGLTLPPATPRRSSSRTRTSPTRCCARSRVPVCTTATTRAWCVRSARPRPPLLPGHSFDAGAHEAAARSGSRSPCTSTRIPTRSARSGSTWRGSARRKTQRLRSHSGAPVTIQTV